MIYIEEIERANNTLRETLRSKESALSSPFIQEVIRQSLRLE